MPCLHRAFTPGASRQEVDRLVSSLHQLRNRIAHHEPLLRTDMTAKLGEMTRLATLIDPDLGRYLAATSSIPHRVTQRPRL